MIWEKFLGSSWYILIMVSIKRYPYDSNTHTHNFYWIKTLYRVIRLFIIIYAHVFMYVYIYVYSHMHTCVCTSAIIKKLTKLWAISQSHMFEIKNCLRSKIASSHAIILGQYFLFIMHLVSNPENFNFIMWEIVLEENMTVL